MTDNLDPSAHSETVGSDVHNDTGGSVPPADDHVESSEAEPEIAAAPLSESFSPPIMPATNDTEVRTPPPTQPPQVVAEDRHPQVASLHAMFPDFDDAVLCVFHLHFFKAILNLTTQDIGLAICRR
jgi:hypothetical protein